ncbi:MAG: signal peptidase II [Spirochaetales bacterium]|nr:signal peptidase II [Spirochaetales bacterium]
MSSSKRTGLIPLILSVFIIGADQITKAIVVGNIAYHTIGPSFFGDFFRIIHTRNPAIAFSIGSSLPEEVRSVLFIIIPLLILTAAVVYFIKSDDLSGLQRWAAAGIIGGGLGNLIDRIFRPMGVVDFLDVKFFGIFGMQRWPTFNIADSAVVICGILLVVSMLIQIKDEEKLKKRDLKDA